MEGNCLTGEGGEHNRCIKLPDSQSVVYSAGIQSERNVHFPKMKSLSVADIQNF